MTETYTLVGTDPSWSVALMPVPGVIMVCLVKRFRKQRPAFTWHMAFAVAYFLACSLLAVPMEWILAGACFMVGIAFLWVIPKDPKMASRSAPFRRVIGLAVIAYCCGISLLFLKLPSMLSQDVTLNQDSVTFRDHRMTAAITIPRSNIEVNVIGPTKHWYLMRPWSGWYVKTGPDHLDSGLDFSGIFIYWGPHGLIRGDDLAQHFVRWANVTPTVTKPLRR